jgi:hypothetical protein
VVSAAVPGAAASEASGRGHDPTVKASEALPHDIGARRSGGKEKAGGTPWDHTTSDHGPHFIRLKR